MKKLIFSFIAIITFSVFYAQNTQLLDKEWFLYSMTINQVDYPLPTTTFEPNATVKLQFTAEMFAVNEVPCPDGYSSPIEYTDENLFSIDHAGTALLTSCGYSPTFDNYFTMHYGIFGTEELPNNPFSYIISNDGHSLEVTNPAGDKAFYGDTQLLSSKSFSKNSFAIAPNPVMDILQFSGIDQIENSSITIYDVFGKRILNNESVKWDCNSIDVSKLESGIYFLKIRLKDGDVVNKRFIKI